jgi:Enoyl-(Acyl carrier protein) reductase
VVEGGGTRSGDIQVRVGVGARRGSGDGADRCETDGSADLATRGDEPEATPASEWPTPLSPAIVAETNEQEELRVGGRPDHDHCPVRRRERPLTEMRSGAADACAEVGDHDGHCTPLADGPPVLVGGYGPAQAAKEALTRDLSAELAPQGIRVIGLRPQGMPETRTIKDAFEPRAKASGMTWEQWQESLASRTHPRRLMTLEEMANVAAFMASDKASGMTGTTVNLTMGSRDD